jgi:hypothetical protein
MADHNIIADDNYYLTHGLGGLLLGFTNYQEVNQAYSRLPEETIKKVQEYVPFPDDFQWSSRFKAVQEHFKATGELPSLGSGEADESSLASWVGAQRQHLKRGTLSDDRIRLLNAELGPWKVDSKEAAWVRQFNELKAFYAQHGRIPTEGQDEKPQFQLALWLGGQKRQYSLGRLSQERVAMLDTDLPIWRRTKEDDWKGNLEKVAAFKTKTGNLPVASASEDEERYLGLWLTNNRANSNLSAGRAHSLDEAIPEWRIKQADQWILRLQQAVSFWAAHGDVPKQRDSAEAGFIGKWILAQKRQYKEGNLSREREQLLDEQLPVWRESHDTRWEKNLDALVSFVSEHGVYPSARSEDEVTAAIGAWIGIQRSFLRDGKLLPERKAKLDASLAFWEDLWKHTLNQVADYVTANGSMPSGGRKDKAEAALAQWVTRQRTMLRTGELLPEKEKELDRVLDSWRTSRLDNWPVILEDVHTFTLKHGVLPSASASASASASPAEKKLNTWLSNQNSRMRRGMMPSDRIALMDSKAPGWRMSPDDKWMERVSLVADYKQKTGKFPAASYSDVPELKKWGIWLSNHRSMARAGTLEPERELVLDVKLPGWRGDEDKWERDMASVVSYFHEHDTYPKGSSDDSNVVFMAGWLSDARKRFRNGKMSLERSAALNAALPHWNDLWKTSLYLVSKFIDSHGRMPSSDSENTKEEELGRWVDRQRNLALSDTLDPDKAAALNSSVPAWLSSPELVSVGGN